MTSTSPEVKEALHVMDCHINALNTHDEKALSQTMHFPHLRLSKASLKIWQTPDDYFTDFRQRAGDSWNHSEFRDIQILAVSDVKVHLDAEIVRYDCDDNIVSQFRSLWVIIKENGTWAAKMRSSFAPQ